MINVNISIITRTIPATPRSRDYPQGYLMGSTINNQKFYTEVMSEVKSRTTSQPQIDIIQFVRENRSEVLSALMEDGVISIDGSIRTTGDITSNQNFK